jgi:hypothetical protein
VDLGSLQENGGPPRWAGAGGACGAFDDDPTGKYIVIGFSAGSLHPWQASRPNVIYLGPEPAGEQYERALVRLAALGSPLPPSVGDSPPAQQATSSSDWFFLSAIGAGTLLITLVLLLVAPGREPRDDSRRNHPGGPPGD